MKKGIIIVMILFIAIAGIGYGVSNLISTLKEDAKQAEHQRKEIDTLYDTLNENATLFNEKREEYNALMEDLYYSTIPEQNDAIVQVLTEYDKIIENIQTIGNELNEKCRFDYTNSGTNQKCSSYKISYESAMTVFIADLRRYNTLVENYNEWTKENPTYKKINTYVSKNVE